MRFYGRRTPEADISGDTSALSPADRALVSAADTSARDGRRNTGSGLRGHFQCSDDRNMYIYNYIISIIYYIYNII